MSKSQKLLLAACSLVLLIVIFVSQMPKDYRIAREVVVEATPESVHAQLADLTNWQTWSPWAEDDDTLVTTLGNQTQGVGASQSWTGRDGDGALTITEVKPNESISYDLSFNESTKAQASIIYREQEPGFTKITWTMSGVVDSGIASGLFAIFMDDLVGPYFELGLGKLKVLLEED